LNAANTGYQTCEGDPAKPCGARELWSFFKVFTGEVFGASPRGDETKDFGGLFRHGGGFKPTARLGASLRAYTIIYQSLGAVDLWAEAVQTPTGNYRDTPALFMDLLSCRAP